jgi:hypothetical protein
MWGRQIRDPIDRDATHRAHCSGSICSCSTSLGVCAGPRARTDASNIETRLSFIWDKHNRAVAGNPRRQRVYVLYFSWARVRCDRLLLISDGDPGWMENQPQAGAGLGDRIDLGDEGSGTVTPSKSRRTSPPTDVSNTKTRLITQ